MERLKEWMLLLLVALLMPTARAQDAVDTQPAATTRSGATTRPDSRAESGPSDPALRSEWDALIAKIKQQIKTNTTPRHVPAKVLQVSDIPRTKSNKIVELAVRNVVHGRPVKNVEALANPEALEYYRDRPELRS